MPIQKFRLQRGWSQQQLADLSGLSVRTIQRMENGHAASVESLKALAAVFEVDFHLLKESSAVAAPATSPLSPWSSNVPVTETQANGTRQEETLFHLRKPGSFYRHLAVYLFVMLLLFLINAHSFTRHGWWVQWPALGWGLGLVLKGARIFGWPRAAAGKRRQAEKRLLRKP